MKRTIEVLREYASERWSLSDFMATLNEAVGKIPEEHKAAARVELGEGGDSCGTLAISYEREETDEEIAARKMRDEQHKMQLTANEFAIYHRLKAKFEPGESK